MKNIIKFIALITLCFNSKSHSQSIQPLNLGDELSQTIWNMPLKIIGNPEDKMTISLNDYKDKLIILDFWATWCGSCVTSMPRIHQLEQQFKDIVVLPVAYEPEKKVSEFIKQNKILSRLKISSIVDDSVLKKIFPHRLLPHYVWIYKGKVSSITDAKDITEANISTILNSGFRNWDTKEDIIVFDRNIPLQKNESSKITQNLMFTSLLAKHIPGIGALSGKSKDSISNRIYFINRPIMALFEYVFGSSFKNRIVIDARKQERFIFIKNGEFWGNWAKENTFCYEVSVPLNSTKKEIDKIIMQDIDRYLGLSAKVEKRKIECLIVAKKAEINKSNLKERTFSKNPIESNFNFYYAGGPIYPIVINESGFMGDIKIENYTGDISILRNKLKAYDLELVPEVREFDCLVISDTR